MKRKQRAIKDFDFSDYDFSDCVEITGDALYLINGGAEIEIVSRNKYLRYRLSSVLKNNLYRKYQD